MRTHEERTCGLDKLGQRSRADVQDRMSLIAVVEAMRGGGLMGIRNIEVSPQLWHRSLRNQFQKQRGEEDLSERLVEGPEGLQVILLYDCFMADYATEIQHLWDVE